MGNMITIPLDDYHRLQAAAQELADIQMFDQVTADLRAGREELVPASFVYPILAGENPLRIWRTLRGLSQSALASMSGVNRVQIAEIELGRKTGSVETVRKLAAALDILVDDLL